MYQAHKLAGKMLICSRQPVAGDRRIQWLPADANDDCPVCLYWKAKWSRIPRGTEPPEDLRQLLADIKAMQRVSWNVVCRQLGDKKNVGPLIYSQGLTLAQVIWNKVLGDPGNGIQGHGDICHPTTGRDFILKKKPKGGSTFPDYSDSQFADPSPAGTPEEWERWLANLNDLEPTRNSFEELARALRIHLGAEQDGDGFDTGAFEPAQGRPVAVQVKPPARPSSSNTTNSNGSSSPAATVTDTPSASMNTFRQRPSTLNDPGPAPPRVLVDCKPDRRRGNGLREGNRGTTPRVADRFTMFWATAASARSRLRCRSDHVLRRPGQHPHEAREARHPGLGQLLVAEVPSSFWRWCLFDPGGADAEGGPEVDSVDLFFGHQEADALRENGG
jgi:hypothetical protein